MTSEGIERSVVPTPYYELLRKRDEQDIRDSVAAAAAAVEGDVGGNGRRVVELESRIRRLS